MEESDSEEPEEEPEPNTMDTKCGDYAIVSILSKTKTNYFIALVLQVTSTKKNCSKRGSMTYIVKFLKKISQTNFNVKCIYPDEEDIATIYHKEIMQILPQPEMSRRQHYLFPLNKLKYPIE